MHDQISWLLQKPTDLDLHCLQDRAYTGSAGQGLKSVTHPGSFRHMDGQNILEILSMKISQIH